MRIYALLICCFISSQVNAKLLNDGYLLINQTKSTPHNIWQHPPIKDKLPKHDITNYDIGISGDFSTFEYHLTYQEKDKKTRLDTLYTQFDINDNLNIKAGKFVENWQIGYVFNPLAVTDPYYDPNSLGVLPVRQIGIHAMSVNYHFNNGDSFSFYKSQNVNDDAIQGDGYRSSAIRWHHILSSNSDLSLIAHKKHSAKLGIGIGLRTIINDNAQLYGSIFTRQGTTKGVHLGVLKNNPNLIATSNPIGEYRKNDNKQYPRALLGFQYTTDDNLDIIMELSYDKRNMNKQQWKTYQSLIDNHKTLSGASSINLAWDLSLINPKTRLRQYHHFLGLKKTLNDYQFVFHRHTSQDLSALNQIKLSYNWGDDLTLLASLSKTTGGGKTEYGEYFPYKNQLDLNLLYNFSL